MGLIRAAVGSIGGALADQWKDFYTVPEGIAPTAAMFAAVPRGENAGAWGGGYHGGGTRPVAAHSCVPAGAVLNPPRPDQGEMDARPIRDGYFRLTNGWLDCQLCP